MTYCHFTHYPHYIDHRAYELSNLRITKGKHFSILPEGARIDAFALKLPEQLDAFIQEASQGIPYGEMRSWDGLL
jgi:hypothetical protein